MPPNQREIRRSSQSDKEDGRLTSGCLDTSNTSMYTRSTTALLSGAQPGKHGMNARLRHEARTLKQGFRSKDGSPHANPRADATAGQSNMATSMQHLGATHRKAFSTDPAPSCEDTSHTPLPQLSKLLRSSICRSAAGTPSALHPDQLQTSDRGVVQKSTWERGGGSSAQTAAQVGARDSERG